MRVICQVVLMEIPRDGRRFLLADTGVDVRLGSPVDRIMVENGYPPSFAYAKAIRSLRSVIDVMDEVGIEEYISRRSSRML